MPRPSPLSPELVDSLEHFAGLEDEALAALKAALITRFEEAGATIQDILVAVTRIPMDGLDGGYHLGVKSTLPNAEWEMNIMVDGSVTLVRELTDVNRDEIVGSCILKPYPMIINPETEQEQQVRVVEGCLHIGTREQTRPLRVVCLGQDPIINHDPLQVHSDSLQHDRHAWLPTFDREGLKALVVNRYAWGMNVGVAFLDVEVGVIYCWICLNFDHPVGLALRSREDKVEIFLDNNGVTRRNVWSDPERQLPCLENFYHDSGWKDLRVEVVLDDLWTWLQFNRMRGTISEPVNLNDHFSKREDELLALLQAKNYDGAISHGQETITTPLADKSERGFMRSYDEVTSTKYNMACAYALSQRPDEAVCLLVEIEPKWQDWDHLVEDADLESIRDHPGYRELLSRHVEVSD
jgi:hypothetical protein